MNITQFNQTLKKAFNVKSIEYATIEQIKSIIESNDLKERASISSSDLDIEDYNNTSKVYELEEHKYYLVVAESSERDVISFANRWDTALKIATDFCAR